MKADIVRYAGELGFDMVRIASPDLDAVHQDTFARWIDAEMHGEMAYLKRRCDAGRSMDDLLAGVQSVITLALNYFREDTRPAMANDGVVSRYAVTRDYHKVIGGRLKQLDRHIVALGGQTRYYVDTGPVFERGYAEASGIGYVGKNTCIITKPFGSWVFLAELLCTLPLPPDKNNLTLSCGRCRRCLDACPTDAINEDLTIDSRRCISYLTIENRGPIPEALRAGVGNLIFGCDICQEVCPHNSRAQTAALDELQNVRIHDRVLPLQEILEIRDDEAFLNRFAGTPLMRAKRRGLVRNACVVAGNVGDAALLPALQAIADGDDAMLAEHADWAIAKINRRPSPADPPPGTGPSS